MKEKNEDNKTSEAISKRTSRKAKMKKQWKLVSMVFMVVIATVSIANAWPSQYNPTVEWSRSTFTSNPNSNQVMMTPVVADVTGQQNVPDGAPDIIFTTFDPALTPGEYIRHGIIRVLDGATGNVWFSTGYCRTPNWGVVPIASVAVADLDNDGKPEIIAILDDREGTINNNLICFSGQDGNLKWFGQGPGLPSGVISGGPTIANIGVDGYPPHIIVGNFVWNRGGAVVAGYPYNSCGTGRYLSCVADLDGDSIPEVIAGHCAFNSVELWDHQSTLPDGFNAIADFDGIDGPEVVLVGWDTNAPGTRVWVLNGLTGAVLCTSPVLSTDSHNKPGGPPCIADVDGDGVPEIGVALGHRTNPSESKYVVLDVTTSFSCTIMWSVVIRDSSSGVTSSSAFDFDQDGEYDIVYSDECELFIFGGSGSIHWQTGDSPSYTACENPVIADVDNDKHAEIVVPLNNYKSSACGCPSSNTGIEVWGNDGWWQCSRNIWNQHTYHITNIEDDATVPSPEQNNWETFINGKILNNYRVQAECPIPAVEVPAITPLSFLLALLSLLGLGAITMRKMCKK